MAGLNKVMIIGNLGREPDMRYTANGNAVTTFSVAANESYTSNGERKETVEWVNVVTWNKLAEICGQSLTKGRQVYVEGRLSTRSWEGPDGAKKYRTEVVANTVLFLDKAQNGGNSEEYEPDDLPFE